jgi:outer membrane receptor protein involved in Fe transport
MGADSLVDPAAWFGQGRSAYRSFSDLEEMGWNLGLDYKVYLGEAGSGPSVKVGANYRTADRDAESSAYAMINAGLTDAERAQSPEAIFTDPNFAASKFFMQIDNQVGNYTAKDRILSGYAMTEIPLSARMRLVAGARVESADLEVVTNLPGLAPSTAQLQNVDVLPSVALNVALTMTQNLRFSASQTLSRPEYRELSGTYYREIASGRGSLSPMPERSNRTTVHPFAASARASGTRIRFAPTRWTIPALRTTNVGSDAVPAAGAPSEMSATSPRRGPRRSACSETLSIRRATPRCGRGP